MIDAVAESFQTQLEDLVRLFGSNRRAAEFLGLTHSRFPAWLAGDLPSARSLQRIVDGASVIEQLRAHGLSAPELMTQLHSLWPELSARPVDLVRTDAARAVLDAVTLRYGAAATLQANPEGPAPDLAAALQALAAAAAASAAALIRGSA